MRCILQIEDDENDVFLLQYAFRQAGITHPLRHVANGRQALEYLRGEPPYGDRGQYPLPCLVLLDLKLPLVPGLEVLKWIRSQPAFQTLVVVVFSSSANPQDVRNAYQHGANAFAVKPADAHRRLDFARSLFGWWFAFAQLPLEAPV